MSAPINLYFWTTPNGYKISIALEEMGLDYTVIPVNIGRGEQFEPRFLKISPNNKIPAIVDPDGPGGREVSVFESGAILIYLAEKSGQFLPTEPVARLDVLQWLMWQMAGFGPMLGQLHHFKDYAPEKIEYGIERYLHEGERLYGVLDSQLEGKDFVCGELSIADFAIYPWTLDHENEGIPMQDYPNVAKWCERMSVREAVKRGLALLEGEDTTLDDEAREHLFGKRD